jgi:alkanesulfonate monooxygenase SsuD/methylene tetrahydromethanopterin reductase-like flavin-dependent oxidoreductase (luciferase family)
VKVGIVLPLFSGDAERVLAFAGRAEDLGFDGAFAFDHFFPPGANPDRPSLEAFTMLAAVGASTSRIRVGTLVTRAQLRPAGVLAKMAVQLDHITGGRMILGVGTGDPIDDPEHRAFGIRSLRKRERRAHLTETVSAVKALFRGEPWKGGDHVPAMDGPVLPGPSRPGGPPVWIGGLADEVVRIAGSVADGWNGWGLDPPAFRGKASILQQEVEAAGHSAEATWAGIVLLGRDEEEVRSLLEARRARGMTVDDIWAGTPERFRVFVDDLEQAGARWVIAVAAGPADRLDMLAEVLPRPGDEPLVR